MRIGDKIRLFIGNEWKSLVCVAIEETDENDCVFVCDDDPSIIRKLPEWLADLC